jgi:hypothetical protein
MKTLSKLLIALTLTACGTGEMSDEQKEKALSETEKSEEIPDLSRWQIMPEAKDSCTLVSADEVSCTSEFQAGKENCSDATFKFIAKKDGYMHVITLEHVFIRQGEPHRIEFKGKPDTFNIQDQYADEQYHAFQCYGSNGEVIRL